MTATTTARIAARYIPPDSTEHRGPVEEPLKVRINGNNVVTSLPHGSATVWDGKPKYCSWYA